MMGRTAALQRRMNGATSPRSKAENVIARRTRVTLTNVALIIAVGMIVAGLISYTLRSADRSTAAAARELHSVQVMLETQQLLSALQDVESGERGYLLTGDRTFLEPYHRGLAEAPARFNSLRTLTADNAVQQHNLSALKRLIDAKNAFAQARVADIARGERNAALIATGEGNGRVAMDAVRRVVAAILAEEDRLLIGRKLASEAAARTATRAVALVVGFGVLVLAGAIVAGLAAARAAETARELARTKLIDDGVRARLETRVAERTRELDAANDTLRQMQKMEAIGQLTGGIAHDFNNMLSVVIGSLDLVVRRIERGRTDILPLIDNAMEGAKRAATLTARLLAFSRQQTLVPTVVDANALVASMSELLRRTLGENIRLETVLAGGLWRTKADAGQIENALLNLAVNARDAMENGGHLTIETANISLDEAYAADNGDVTAGQYIMLAVTDTGTGMPPEVVARAFDPFFTTKAVGKGTGLGLSQVFGFIKQSHGHVKVYSEHGHGTTIKLYLPRHTGTDDVVAVAGEVTEMPRARTGETILVVEDETRVRDVSVTALRELGYTVYPASSAEEALRLLGESLPVTLLFTDIVMPGLNGRQLHDRAVVMRPGLPVLYTTGYTRNAVVHGGTLDPGTAFLAKPFSIANLALKVRQTIDGCAAA